MKQLIIAAIVCFALVAQSSDVAIDRAASNGQAVAVTGSQQLTPQEMTATVGGETDTSCWSYVDNDMDLHYVCCVDLWIITICAGVNWSAIDRILPF